jgi:hypothetical protein
VSVPAQRQPNTALPVNAPLLAESAGVHDKKMRRVVRVVDKAHASLHIDEFDAEFIEP